MHRDGVVGATGPVRQRHHPGLQARLPGIIQGYKLVYQEKVNFTRRTHLIGAHLLRQQARTQRYLTAPKSLLLLRLFKSEKRKYRNVVILLQLQLPSIFD